MRYITILFGIIFLSQVQAHSDHIKIKSTLTNAEQKVVQHQSRLMKVEVLLDKGRSLSEEKYYRQARKILQQDKLNSPMSLVYEAEIAQYFHEFDMAIELLNKSKQNVTTHLMKANTYITQGKVEQASESCKKLYGRTETIIYMTCIAKVTSMQGKLDKSYRLMNYLITKYETDKNADKTILHWAYVTTAEMAERMNKPQVAEKYYQQSLKINQHDIATRIAYADILLANKRYKQVEALTRDYLQHDPLMLRYVRALNIQGDLRTSAHFCELKRRILNYDEKKSHLHYDTLAEYYYYFNQGQALAIKYANKHWQQQKTPRDARLLAKVAASQYDEPAIQSIQQWLVVNKTEDALLKSLLSEVFI